MSWGTFVHNIKVADAPLNPVFVGFGRLTGAYSGSTDETWSFTETNSIPSGWTVLFSIQTREATTLFIPEPNAAWVNGTSSTRIGVAEAVDAGQPGGVNWDHKWTSFYVENWTGSTLSTVRATFPTGFTNTMVCLAFAVPPRPSGYDTTVYGIYAPTRFATSANRSLNDTILSPTPLRVGGLVMNSTDTSLGALGGFTASTNPEGLIDQGVSGNTSSSTTATYYWGTTRCDNVVTVVTVSIPGSNTGASFSGPFAEYRIS